MRLVSHRVASKNREGFFRLGYHGCFTLLQCFFSFVGTLLHKISNVYHSLKKKRKKKDGALVIKGALQTIQLCKKDKELKEREMKILSL